MLTVTQLARQFGISRATLLYYEREGLLTPVCRSENGYRWYGEKEVSLLGDILAYRHMACPSQHKVTDFAESANAAADPESPLQRFGA